jgi:multidrug resistance efflux pump
VPEAKLLPETTKTEPRSETLEARSQPETAEAKHETAWSPDPIAHKAPRRWRPVLALFITLAVVVLAAGLGRRMWAAYMDTPWTRDGTVRAYVVTMAPEVAGRIVELPVRDNQFVHTGELLMAIDPTDYEIAVSQAEASVQQAQAGVQNNDAQMTVQQAQIRANQAQLDQARAARMFAQQQAERYRTLAQNGSGSVQNAQQYLSQLHQQDAAVETASANLNLVQQQVESLRAQRASAEGALAQTMAQLRQAQVNLERTRILSPADGYVTNLLAQLGDFVNVGAGAISVVDAKSFWVDGYFEETTLASIHVGDPAQIKLMGYREMVRGHVESIARAINVANAEPNNQGVATVNPIFTWVRLAQRVPVRIRIDRAPDGVELVAGMTATVQIDQRKPK